MKKTINLLALFVLVSVNAFTPSYESEAQPRDWNNVCSL